MKQPVNNLAVCTDADPGEVWVDIEVDSDCGGYCNVGIGVARTEKTAYKHAAKRLKKLADEAMKKYESL